MAKIKYCPICLAENISFAVQDAPSWYKTPAEPVLYLDCPNCRKYWINASRKQNGDAAIHPRTANFLVPLSGQERQYLSECVQRLIDQNCWVIIDETSAESYLADWLWGQTSTKLWGFDQVRLMISGGGFDAQNRLFFVIDDNGVRRYVLRLIVSTAKPNQIRTLIDWMGRLRAAGVPTMTPVPGLNGSLIQTAQMGDQTRQAVVFNWIDAVDWDDHPEDRITPELVRNFGRAVGLTHHVSATMDIPAWYTGRHYDEKCFAEYMTTLKSRAHAEYTAEQFAVFDDLEQRLLKAMATLGKSRDVYGIIPADLSAGNTIVHGAQPYIVDMMNFGWGYFLADLQKALRHIKDEDQPTFFAAYEEVRPLPKGFDPCYKLFDETRRIAGHWF